MLAAGRREAAKTEASGDRRGCRGLSSAPTNQHSERRPIDQSSTAAPAPGLPTEWSRGLHSFPFRGKNQTRAGSLLPVVGSRLVAARTIPLAQLSQPLPLADGEGFFIRSLLSPEWTPLIAGLSYGRAHPVARPPQGTRQLCASLTPSKLPSSYFH